MGVFQGQVYANLTDEQCRQLASIEGNGYGTGILPGLLNQALNLQTGPNVATIVDPPTATAEDVANAFNDLVAALIQANVIADS